MTSVHYIAFVGLGGALGSISRYVLQLYAGKWYPGPFPLGTLFVNCIGTMILASALFLGEKYINLNQETKLLITTGFCGGLTTFSAFSYENFVLLQNTMWHMALLNILSNIVFGVLGIWIVFLILK